MTKKNLAVYSTIRKIKKINMKDRKKMVSTKEEQSVHGGCV
jgi:hypothetical protein